MQVYQGVVPGSSPLEEKGKKQDWAQEKLGCNVVSSQGSANPYEDNGPSALTPLVTPYWTGHWMRPAPGEGVMILGEPTLPS